MSRTISFRAVVGLLAALAALPAFAQKVDWPTKPVIDKFHAELVAVFNQPDVRKQLGETLGMDLVVSSPTMLQKFVVAETARWGKVVRENNIRAE